MSLFKKFESLSAQYARLEAIGANPFAITFDRVLSPTEAMIGNSRILLLGTNNYLGLTYDADSIAKAVQATQAFGTGTTG